MQGGFSATNIGGVLQPTPVSECGAKRAIGSCTFIGAVAAAGVESDHRSERNFLKGLAGDQIKVLMAAVVYNFKKWMRVIIFWLRNIPSTLRSSWYVHDLQSVGA